MDDIDRSLIRVLEHDGRASHEELARQAHVSRQTAAERLARLIRVGDVEIRGVAHPGVLGISAMAYAVIDVVGPVRGVAEAVAEDSRIPFVSIVSGARPVVAEIRAESPEAVADAVARIREIDGVHAIDTTRYISLIRDVVGPVGELDTTLDRIDRRLMTELEDDGRMSYVELARRVGVSGTNVRRRVLRLVEARALHVGAVVRHTGRDGLRSIGVGLRLRGATDPIVERLRTHPSVFFVATALGQYDIVLTLRVATADESLALVEEMRGWHGVGSAETWLHFAIVKETYAGLRNLAQAASREP